MSQVAQIARRLCRQPAFLVAFVVLFVAAISLNGATQLMRLHFKKVAVPPARELETIPIHLGPWVCVSRDELNGEVEQELATQRYVFRDYINTAVFSESDVRAFDGKTNKERKAELDALRRRYRARQPSSTVDRAILNVAVTYYTGKADTVAHIPDRCYVADGYEPSAYEVVSWDLPPAAAGEQGRQVKVRFISFEDQATTQLRLTKNVAYLFHCNGAYESDPTHVRMQLQNLWQKYGYYAKIELMTLEKDRTLAAESMQSFLRYALPEFEKTMPDWASLPR